MPADTVSAIRPSLLKVAVGIRESASRVRLAFAAYCPDADLLRDLIRFLVLPPDLGDGASVPVRATPIQPQRPADAV